MYNKLEHFSWRTQRAIDTAIRIYGKHKKQKIYSKTSRQYEPPVSVSFKTQSRYAERSEIDVIRYELNHERSMFVGELAYRWAELRRKENRKQQGKNSRRYIFPPFNPSCVQ